MNINIPINANNVIFDLDGTIINSADSIFQSLSISLELCNIKPLVDLNTKLIGPSLSELITYVSGLTIENPVHNEITKQFHRHYDNIGYLSSKEYPGMLELMASLNSKGIRIWIATNKRKIPTIRILKLLDILPIIENVYTLDSFIPIIKSKTELLQTLVAKEFLIASDCVYVGDRESDKKAASQNKIKFIMVPWGYEN